LLVISRNLVVRRDGGHFASSRAPQLMARLIELVKMVDAGQAFPEPTAEDEEAELKLAGVDGMPELFLLCRQPRATFSSSPFLWSHRSFVCVCVCVCVCV
jgi:hypothetical protein